MAASSPAAFLFPPQGEDLVIGKHTTGRATLYRPVLPTGTVPLDGNILRIPGLAVTVLDPKTKEMLRSVKLGINLPRDSQLVLALLVIVAARWNLTSVWPGEDDSEATKDLMLQCVCDHVTQMETPSLRHRLFDGKKMAKEVGKLLGQIRPEPTSAVAGTHIAVYDWLLAYVNSIQYTNSMAERPSFWDSHRKLSELEMMTRFSKFASVLLQLKSRIPIKVMAMGSRRGPGSRPLMIQLRRSQRDNGVISVPHLWPPKSLSQAQRKDVCYLFNTHSVLSALKERLRNDVIDHIMNHPIASPHVNSDRGSTPSSTSTHLDAPSASINRDRSPDGGSLKSRQDPVAANKRGLDQMMGVGESARKQQKLTALPNDIEAGRSSNLEAAPRSSHRPAHRQTEDNNLHSSAQQPQQVNQQPRQASQQGYRADETLAKAKYYQEQTLEMKKMFSNHGKMAQELAKNAAEEARKVEADYEKSVSSERSKMAERRLNISSTCQSSELKEALVTKVDGADRESLSAYKTVMSVAESQLARDSEKVLSDYEAAWLQMVRSQQDELSAQRQKMSRTTTERITERTHERINERTNERTTEAASMLGTSAGPA